MATAEVLPLTRLGEYELFRRIATGATSEIYEARRVGPHGFTRRVAVKRVLPQLASDVRFVRMFCDEARVHAGLDHPNLVAVLDFGEHAGELYMAMEYVEGTTLAEVMGVGGRRRRIPLAPALRITREILSGLAHVHAASDANGAPLGLVHRDVAPGNVLLGASGEIKLTDFGIVRSASAETRTLPGELRGKLGYVSPEQAMGARVDGRSDLFSVGVLLAEMLTGEPLFAGKTELEVLTQLHAGDLSALERHGRDVPREVHALLRRFLAQRPIERMADAVEAIAEVDRLVAAFGAFIGRVELAEYFASHGVRALVSNTRLRAARPAAPEASIPAPHSGEVSYRFRRPGGTIVGPLSLAHLLEMVATARAGLDSEVSRNQGPFLPVSAMAELAQVAARPAYRFFDPVALVATERHPIAPGIVARQLCIAIRHRRTGLICVRTGTIQRRFYFVSGSLVASSSTEPDELIGRMISERHRVPAEMVDSAIERGLRSGKAVGPALLEAGLVREEDLTQAVRDQRIRRLSRALAAAQGDLFFVEGANAGEPDRGADSLISLRDLVVAMREGSVETQVREVLAPAAREALVPCSEPRALFAELELNSDEQAILQRVAALGSIDLALQEVPRAALPEARRAIFIGLVVGILRRRRAR
ncbi:MAG TPA: serine/threonine-protein kinase [Polyangiaceae bacterium]